MLRPIAIALILVLSVGVMLPFANEAHGIRQTVEVGQQRRHHRRHRSRAWWRRYRARLQQKRLDAEMAAHRKQTLALPQNINVAELQGLSGPELSSLPSNSATSTALPPPVMTGSVAPVANHSNGETRPRVVNPSHPAFKTTEAKVPGQMNLAVVAMSRPNPTFLTSREEKKMLGGVAVADLRRMVIDKMVSSGGWVVNDFVGEVNGARVFVVTARTPKDALTPEKVWTFYFTEAGGRIYGLTTDTTVENAERMSTEAERFIDSLRSKAATADGSK